MPTPMLTVTCPQCGKSGKLPASHARSVIRCKVCLRSFSPPQEKAKPATEPKPPARHSRILIMSVIGCALGFVILSGLLALVAYLESRPQKGSPGDQLRATAPMVDNDRPSQSPPAT